jgi:hypothetical protein
VCVQNSAKGRRELSKLGSSFAKSRKHCIINRRADSVKMGVKSRKD